MIFLSQRLNRQSLRKKHDFLRHKMIIDRIDHPIPFYPNLALLSNQIIKILIMIDILMHQDLILILIVYEVHNIANVRGVDQLYLDVVVIAERL